MIVRRTVVALGSLAMCVGGALLLAGVIVELANRVLYD